MCIMSTDDDDADDDAGAGIKAIANRASEVHR
jgi:hypothetical protein